MLIPHRIPPHWNSSHGIPWEESLGRNSAWEEFCMRGILHERNPDGTEKMYSHKHAKILYQIKTPTYKKFGKYRTKFAIFFKVKT